MPDDSSAKTRRLGAIYPDDAWVDVEQKAVIEDFRSFMPPGVELISAATHIPARDATLANAVQWATNGEIEEAARRLARYRPAGYAYYCTTISFARGPGGDLEIAQRITKSTGKPATTTSTAMIAALHALRITRVAVASPYLPDVQRQFEAFLEAGGICVVGAKSLQLPDGHSIVPSTTMAELVVACDVPKAEAIFVGCTGQRLGREIERLEAKLRKPVLTANQVTSWHALKMIGIAPVLGRRGRLFSEPTDSESGPGCTAD